MTTKELSESLHKVLSANPSMGTGVSMHDRVMALFADWIHDNVPGSASGEPGSGSVILTKIPEGEKFDGQDVDASCVATRIKDYCAAYKIKAGVEVLKAGKIKRWAVTAVDTDPDGQCDGKARVIGTFRTEEEARSFALEDMREYLDGKAEQFAANPSNNDFVMDEAAMKVHDSIDANVCEWNVEEIEIDL